MRRTLSFVAAGAALFFAACGNTGFKKTKSGLEYKIIAGKGNEKDSTFKAGEFVKFNVEFSVKRKGKSDTTLYTTYEGMPTYTMVDTSVRAQLSYMELIPLAKVGDSLDFKVQVDTLINRGLVNPNEIFSKGAVIEGHLTLLKKFKSEPDVNADAMAEFNLEKGKEFNTVKAYLADKKINATQTKDSLFVLVTNPGDQTMKADSGMVATIKYKGVLMKDGKVFDTNMDKSKNHDEPLTVNVGQHMVIPGWDLGLKNFGKGGKGQIFVPAFLGYGPRPNGAIPANSNLIFDIEVLDVKKDTAKKPQMPMMPQMQQGQGAH
ncbi:FKBP-type peptidyl-prolyl cis-trans isomerase [Rhizosphaericola mali]|uniref:Peptidyl-prolyl cis-trans isomerase n=1 Tax=Rhizosphaericola mali TaxID=2545455 RepID=A0A5P2FY91_9BACT|nr:FKBP-type peptidyl-prolyl cis-trans isomerase [Rhizosphaericola mali]QES88466.1 hypothetical protein E0W69_007250 [Rhizosphaericola mali]